MGLCVALALIAGLAFDRVSNATTQYAVKIRLRDSLSGQLLEGSLAMADAAPAQLSSATQEAVLPAGLHEVAFSAAGYHPLATRLSAGEVDDVTVWLDRVDTTAVMRDVSLRHRLPPDHALIYGYVYDENGRPVPDARISIEGRRTAAVADGDGYFELTTHAASRSRSGDMPEMIDLVVEVEGRPAYRRSNISLSEGTMRLIADLKSTSAVVDDTHKLDLSKTGAIDTGSTEEARGLAGEAPRLDAAGAVPVPSSIRVGTNCPTRSTCTGVSVYTLDTYTRLGLDDEWIASWNTNSLKAGAIAFRSYGTYHVFHPLTASYDICNTTSCQVIDPNDSFAASDLATAQTTGTIVVNSAGTDAFFAEYSAENNNGGCPDGFTGNNTTWPCLSDPVDTGQTFNGHGRGMCQWGTQRWAVNQGKDFIWITNHYYNGNGSPAGLRTGVLQLGPNTILAPPELLYPGNSTAPGLTMGDRAVTFKWTPVTGADGYALYISRLNGSTYELIYDSTVALGEPITGTRFTLPASQFPTDGQYRWNMAAHNAGGYGSPNTFRSYFVKRSTCVYPSDGTRDSACVLQSK